MDITELSKHFPDLDSELLQLVIDSVPPELVLDQCIILSSNSTCDNSSIGHNELLVPDAAPEDHGVVISEDDVMRLDALLAVIPLKSAKVVLHCLQNLLMYPFRAEYRVLRRSNDSVRKRIDGFSDVQALMELVGWRLFGDASDYEFHGRNWELLEIAVALLREQCGASVVHPPQPTEPSLDDEHDFVYAMPKTGMFKKKPRHFSKDDLKEMGIQRQRRAELFGSDYQRLPGRDSGKSLTGSPPIRNPREVRLSEIEALRKSDQVKDSKQDYDVIQQRKTRDRASRREWTLRDIEDIRRDEIMAEAKSGKSDTYFDQVGQEALKLTNEYRDTKGLPHLLWHQGLANIGKIHSADMAVQRVPIGHQGFSDRVKKYPFPYSHAAENVAWSKGMPANQVALVAVTGWINSPGHEKNLRCVSTFCGIGVVQAADGGWYFTQLFGCLR